MTKVEAKKLQPGVYCLFWKDGDLSVASVGQDFAGRVWFAPSNWIKVPWYDWRSVKEARLLATQEDARRDNAK